MKAPKPLKLDIEADILARLPADHTVSKKKLQRALKYYVLNIAYKTALIKDVFRYDLDGNPSGPVELEHKDDAKRWIEGVLEVRRVAKAARDAARKMRPQRDPSKPRRDEDGSPRPGSGQRLRSPYSTGRPRQD